MKKKRENKYKACLAINNRQIIKYQKKRTQVLKKKKSDEIGDTVAYVSIQIPSSLSFVLKWKSLIDWWLFALAPKFRCILLAVIII